MKRRWRNVKSAKSAKNVERLYDDALFLPNYITFNNRFGALTFPQKIYNHILCLFDTIINFSSPPVPPLVFYFRLFIGSNQQKKNKKVRKKERKTIQNLTGTLSFISLIWFFPPEWAKLIFFFKNKNLTHRMVVA